MSTPENPPTESARDPGQTHDDEVTLLEDDVYEKWADCRAQLWVAILTIWGALMYTIYAFTMMTKEMRVASGLEVIAGVTALVWVSPVIGTIQTIITAINATKRRREEDLSLSVAFKVIVVLQQILFIGSVAGILWVIFLPNAPNDAASRILQYVFLLCPYILCFKCLFKCHVTSLRYVLCCCHGDQDDHPILHNDNFAPSMDHPLSPPSSSDDTFCILDNPSLEPPEEISKESACPPTTEITGKSASGEANV